MFKEARDSLHIGYFSARVDAYSAELFVYDGEFSKYEN